MGNTLSADEIIVHLGLQPHPEGGYFRETFRDDVNTDANGRAASTAIYFLLKAGEGSHWHTVDGVEVWHWYSGAPLLLEIAHPSGPEAAEQIRVGPDLAAGQQPQAIVPPGHWQRAETTGDFSLVGCTVAPGFEFETFVLAEPGFVPGRK